MNNPLKTYKEEARSFLPAATLALLAWLWPGKVSPSGTVTLTKEEALRTVVVLVALFGGVCSYAYQMWKHQRKRERIRFAREMGRRICNCSETGEIMVEIMKKDEQLNMRGYGLRCPRCKVEEFTAPQRFMPNQRP
jgi:hypothetical protein